MQYARFHLCDSLLKRLYLQVGLYLPKNDDGISVLYQPGKVPEDASLLDPGNLLELARYHAGISRCHLEWLSQWCHRNHIFVCFRVYITYHKLTQCNVWMYMYFYYYIYSVCILYIYIFVFAYQSLSFLGCCNIIIIFVYSYLVIYVPLYLPRCQMKFAYTQKKKFHSYITISMFLL